MGAGWVVLSVVGVGAFALAQPLLDLLGRNPEFFIARRFPAVDIVLLAGVLMVSAAVLTVPIFLARLIGPKTAAVAHLVVLALVVAVAMTTGLVALGLDIWPAWVFFAAAAGVGVAVSGLYARFGTVRVVVRYLAAAPLVFAAWFVFATPVSALVFSGSSELPEAGNPANPVPVVMMVFDEFPLASVMRGDGSLDAEHYPNLARLASDGVWYRNAVGVRQQTEEALPSILTGVAVSEGSIPTAVDHPFNLFTLLSDAYDVAAVENVTDLCPDFVCANASQPVAPAGERWAAVARDLAVVYGHLTLPDEVSAGLPPIDQAWGGFDQETAAEFDIIERFLAYVADDRRLEVDRFVDTFDTTTGEPMLRFGHFLYPHHPWDLNADGTIHGAPRPPGRFEVGWGPDAFLVAQAWQRHLIQVQATDRMLGTVLDRLVADGLYEDALVMVMADHGITIRPNTEHQRVITEDTIGSIAAVPLFVKYPSGLAGAPPPGTVDDLRAETTDLVPTVAEVVEVAIPWGVDGVSLLNTDIRGRRELSVMLGSKGEVEIPSDDAAVRAVAEEKESWFPGGDPYLLAPKGWVALLGHGEVSGSDQSEVELTIDQAARVAVHVPGSEPVPSYLSGTISVVGAAGGDEIVAVVVDGTVAAVTRVYQAEGSEARWEAMIEPALLDSGPAVEAWLVEGSADDPVFVR